MRHTGERQRRPKGCIHLSPSCSPAFSTRKNQTCIVFVLCLGIDYLFCTSRPLTTLLQISRLCRTISVIPVLSSHRLTKRIPLLTVTAMATTTTSEYDGYEVPSKAIITPAQLEQFQQSATHAKVLGYIETLNDAVAGVKLRDNCHESEVMPDRLLFTHTYTTRLTPCLVAYSCRPSRPSLGSSMMSRRLQSRLLQ